MITRLAEKKDMSQLIKMRWDFTIEDDASIERIASFEEFERECRAFLENALESPNWFIWVAEEHEIIVSHIYIELIQKVPRPGRITYPFAYMTNVYTRSDRRGAGIGSELLKQVNEWAKEQKYEFIIVWPSDTSISYYEKNDYAPCTEPMQYVPSP